MRVALRLVAGSAALVVAGLGAATFAHSPREPAGAPGVLTVLVSGSTGVSDTATGFLVPGHRVVTVAHVLDSGGAVSVRGRGAGRTSARVVRVDRRNDLALLAPAAGDVMPITTAPARRTRLLSASTGGLRVLTVQVRRRIEASVRDPGGGSVYSRAALELSAEVEDGDSGAPLVGTDGRVLGVLFARSEQRPETAYAVDGAAVRRLLAG